MLRQVNVHPPPWMTADRPWLHVTGEGSGPREEPTDSGFVRILDGRLMPTVDTLFDAFHGALSFPSYFGRNWPAFHECVRDLTWLPAPSYRIVIAAASELLIGDLGDRPTFLRLMRDTGRSWAHRVGLGPEWGRGPVAFNTVLVGAPSEWLTGLRW
jgi:hypothetical protein